MALPSRFAVPVSDATEDKLRLTRIPEKTQQATAWGMRVWDDWPLPLLSAFSRECVSTEAYPPLHHLQGLQIDWEAPWRSVRGPFRAAGSEMLTALVRTL